MFASLKLCQFAIVLALMVVLAGLPVTASAQSCPFDDGNSSLAVEG